MVKAEQFKNGASWLLKGGAVVAGAAGFMESPVSMPLFDGKGSQLLNWYGAFALWNLGQQIDGKADKFDRLFGLGGWGLSALLVVFSLHTGFSDSPAVWQTFDMMPMVAATTLTTLKRLCLPKK